MHKSKILKITAYSLAGVVLGGALAYFNFIEKEPKDLTTVGDICPQFTVGAVYKTDGTQFAIDEEKTFNIADYAGKTLVLNFWAPWCVPCRKEIPYFNTLQEKHPNDVAVVVVNNGGEDPEKLLNNYLNDKADINYEESYKHWAGYSCTFVCPEKDNYVLDLFDVSSAVPVTIIVNTKGIVKEMFTKEYHSYTELEQDVIPYI